MELVVELNGADNYYWNFCFSSFNGIFALWTYKIVAIIIIQ